MKMSFRKFLNLTIDQAVEILGITPSRNTYIYLSEDMTLEAIEKSDRRSYPADEIAALGYVTAYER